MKWVKLKNGRPYDGQNVLIIQNPETTATRQPLLAKYKEGKFDPPYVDITHWKCLPKTPKVKKIEKKLNQ